MCSILCLVSSFLIVREETVKDERKEIIYRKTTRTYPLFGLVRFLVHVTVYLWASIHNFGPIKIYNTHSCKNNQVYYKLFYSTLSSETSISPCRERERERFTHKPQSSCRKILHLFCSNSAIHKLLPLLFQVIDLIIHTFFFIRLDHDLKRS